MTLKFEGYVKSSDGFGTGTYEILHPKGASIEITRSLFEGDVLQITSVRNTPDPELEKARRIRLYDGNKKLFDGYLRAPDYRRGSNKYRTLTTGVYDWRKELEAIYITESAGGTESYVNKSIGFILTDLCRIANSAGVVKKQTYKFDLTKLPYRSDASIFEADLVSPTFSGTIWNALMELTKLMDLLETVRTGQWTIKIDSLQDDNYIYIIPQMVSIDNVAFGDFEVGAGFSDLFTHPYGLMLWAQALTDTTSDITLTITYTDQYGSTSNTATVMIPWDTLKGTYFPVPLEPGDTLVKDVTNITGSGGGAGNYVRVEGKGTRTLPDWKLQPPKSIGKDYKKLLNHVVIKGKGNLKTRTLGEEPLLGAVGLTATAGGSSTLLIDANASFQMWMVKSGDRIMNITKGQTCSVVSVDSQTHLTTTPLISAAWEENDDYEMDLGMPITSNNFYINPTSQPAYRHYLKVTILNPTAGDKTGSVKLRGFSVPPPEGPEDLLEERFFLRVPAGQEISHATDNRYVSLSMNVWPNTGLNITGFWGCRVKVEDFMFGVAGRSINLFGLRADVILNMEFDTQLKCDSYAKELVESYHAPVVYISAVVKPKYIDTSDLVGKTVRLEDELTGTQMDFLCTKQVLRFRGTERYEQIEAMRFNYDWEYME